MKYINAEDLRKAMYEETFEKDSEMQKWESGCWIRYKLFENVLDAIPSADVVEVKHGEWKSSYRTWEFTFECSACGKENYEESNFCPNCGADMRERKEAE